MASKETKAAMTPDDPVAHSVAVQLPVFNRLAPTSWFFMADANFHLRGITKSDTKFWYVVSKLDQETLRKLSPFLTRPRGEDPYGEIRSILCRTYEPKLEQKLDALLSTNDMGDERSGEFVLELRRLLDNATTEDILKRIFVRSLPAKLSNAISANLEGSLDALAEAADKAWALSSGTLSTSAVTSTGSEGSDQAVRAQAAATVAAVAGSQARGRGSRQQGARQARQVRQDSRVVLCPFHIKWGDGARRCLPTCSRWETRAPQQQVFHVEEADGEDHSAQEN